ncbi:MAG: BatD family protein [Puniceicoccales bacterium]|jgi:hypothetical protein|nr:BatD family protein [Puniceicoccales bacterium]
MISVCRGWMLAVYAFLYVAIGGVFLCGDEPKFSVTASFEPAEIFADGHSRLIINVHSSIKQTMEADVHMENVNIRRIQVAYEMGKDGDALPFHCRFIYLIIPKQSGTFRLNSSAIVVGGKAIAIPPVTLTVRENIPAIGEDMERKVLLKAANLSVKVPTQTVYVGQIIPVSIALNVRENVRFRLDLEEPMKIGQGIHVGSDIGLPLPKYISSPSPKNKTKKWRTIVSAKDVGNQDLAFLCGISAILPDKNISHLTKAELANGYGKLFGQSQQWIPLTVSSPQISLLAIPVPEENRPKNFSGGIGQFELLPAKVRTGKALRVGKPIEVIFCVQGVGNLSDLRMPDLSLGSQWRLQRSQKSIQPLDPLGLSGIVEFHYTLVPLSRDMFLLPPFTFAYFDPKAREYVTLQCEFDCLVEFGDARTKERKILRPKEILDGKILLQKDLNSPSQNFSDLSFLRSYWFWIIQGLLVGTYVHYTAVFYVRRWKRRKVGVRKFVDLRNVQIEKIRRILQKAYRLMHEKDLVAYYEALKSAVVAASIYAVFRNGLKESVTELLESLRLSNDKKKREIAKKIVHYMKTPNWIKQHNVPMPTLKERERNFFDVIGIVEFVQEIHL